MAGAWMAPSHYLNQCCNIADLTLKTNFSEILSAIQIFALYKIHIKMSSVKFCPFHLDVNVLNGIAQVNNGNATMEPLINLGNKQIQVYDIKIKWNQFHIGNCAFCDISILLPCEFILMVLKNLCTEKLFHTPCIWIGMSARHDCSPHKW